MSSRHRRARRIGCATTLAAVAVPRIALLFVWLAGSAVQRAFQVVVYPFVGLLFLPLTALAYAVASDPAGSVHGVALAWPALGLVADVAMLGAGIYWAVEYRLE